MRGEILPSLLKMLTFKLQFPTEDNYTQCLKALKVILHTLSITKSGFPSTCDTESNLVEGTDSHIPCNL